MTYDLGALRDALTAEWLGNRPSFERFASKAESVGFPGVDRYDYAAVMRDIRQVKALFKAAEIDPETVNVDKIVINSWGRQGDDHFQVKTFLTPKKDAAGDQEAVSILPEPRELVYNTTARVSGGMDTLDVPDLHIGWYRMPDGTLTPLHDPQFIEAMIGVVRYFRPARIIFHGDNLDFAAFGTYVTHPGYLHTIRATVKTAYEYKARFREAAGADCEIVYFAGNHEDRVRKRVEEKIPELAALTVVDSDVSVFSPRHFLRLDELGIRYVEKYGERLFFDGIQYMHGEIIGPDGGDTTSKMLKKYRGRSAQGHTHRLGVNFHTEWTEDGEVEEWAMEVGYGGRMDGVVPGSNKPNWKKGFACTWTGGPNAPVVPAVYPYREKLGGFIIERVVISSALDEAQAELPL